MGVHTNGGPSNGRFFAKTILVEPWFERTPINRSCESRLLLMGVRPDAGSKGAWAESPISVNPHYQSPEKKKVAPL